MSCAPRLVLTAPALMWAWSAARSWDFKASASPKASAVLAMGRDFIFNSGLRVVTRRVHEMGSGLGQECFHRRPGQPFGVAVHEEVICRVLVPQHCHFRFESSRRVIVLWVSEMEVIAAGVF